jgi:hypothetical protein
MIKYKLMVSILLALVIIFLAHISSWMTNAQSQDLNTTSNMTIEDKIEMIMGNRITKLMDDTIDMIKNANTTVITNRSENGITPVTNITDVNNVGVKSIDKLEKKVAGNNTALDLDNRSSIDSPNASMSLKEIKKTQIENASFNEQGTTAFEGQNISSSSSSSSASTINTTENTSSPSDINQKTMNDNIGTHTILDADDNNDNNKISAATTTNKSTSTNNVENFFTQIGEAVKKFFGGN